MAQSAQATAPREVTQPQPQTVETVSSRFADTFGRQFVSLARVNEDTKLTVICPMYLNAGDIVSPEIAMFVSEEIASRKFSGLWNKAPSGKVTGAAVDWRRDNKDLGVELDKLARTKPVFGSAKSELSVGRTLLYDAAERLVMNLYKAHGVDVTRDDIAPMVKDVLNKPADATPDAKTVSGATQPPWYTSRTFGEHIGHFVGEITREEHKVSLKGKAAEAVTAKASLI
jgi:hypothetical protein